MTRRSQAQSDSTILLVDDQEETLLTMRSLLAREGHRVLTARGGPSAIDLFIQERVDLLVIQVVCEASPGDLVDRVRALQPGVPIIMQSGALPPAQRRNLLRHFDLHGIHDRDGDPERLLELVESALAAKRRLSSACGAQELRGLILAKMCHDLRNSLHVIRGYTELLLSDPTACPEDVVARLGMASEAAIELTQDYLDLARLDSPGVIVRQDPVDLDALLDELRIFGRRQIGDRPIRFTIGVPFDGASIETDGKKLRAILVQLLTNAIKFCAAGEIRLTVESSARHTDFVLADSGPGINETDLVTLFNPFRQGRGDSMASTPGQGIGLAMASRLSALIGATLTARSGVHRGAVFTLSLPVTIARRAPHVSEHTLH